MDGGHHAPSVQVDSGPNGLTNDATPTFAFSSEPGVSFECSIDTGTAAFAPCTSPYTPASTLADGSYTFRVRATDAAANQATATRGFSVDTAAPQAPTLTATVPASPANNNSPKVTGSAPAGTTVKLYSSSDCSGSPVATVTAAELQAGITVSVPDDSTTSFSATATTVASNTSGCSQPISYVEDSSAPQTSIGSHPASLVNVATAHFTFSGEDPAGSGVNGFECRRDGGSWAACSSPQDFSGLAEGAHSFEVRAIDKAGNADQTPASFSWTVDTAAPDTSIATHPATLANTATAQFTFSGNDGSGSGVASLQCRRDAEDWTSCASPRTYTGLAEGSHSFEVRGIDNAGNTDQSASTFNWTIDTTPPPVQVDSGPNGLTNDATPTFGFSSEPGATFECSIDSGTPAFAPCTSPYTPSPLTDGSYTFRVRATDGAGNQSPVATRDFTVDTAAPAAPQLSATSPASPANDNNPKVSGTAPAGTTVKLYASADCSGGPVATVAAAELQAGVTVSVPDDTTKSFSATATTASSNTSGCSQPISYVEDSSAPQTSIGSHPASLVNVATAHFTFTGADGSGSGIASYQCRRDGGGWAACSSPQDFSSVADGPHGFEVKAIDNAGNADQSPAGFNWTVDTAPPSAQVDSGPTGLTNDATPTFTFHSPEAGSTFECSVDTGTPAFGPCSDAGSNTPASPLTDGNYTFRVRATDAAGNQGAVATRSFTVDTAIPDAPQLSAASPTSPANDNNPKLSGTAPADTAVKLYASADCSGSPLATVIAAELEAGIPVSVADDSTTAFSATATAVAGGTSPCSASVTYVEDSTSPLTQVDSGPASSSTSSTAEFTFAGEDPGGSGVTSFQCRIDSTQDAAWAPCGSPQSYTGLGDGDHSFQVRAIDRAGNADGNPATYSWNIDTSPTDTLALRTPVRLLRIDYDVRIGTAILLFEVPGPGILSASAPTTTPPKGLARAAKQKAIRWRKAHRIEPQSVRATQAGKVGLPVKLTPKGRKLLRKHPKVKVRMRISFAAKGEATVSRMLAITLKRFTSPRTKRNSARPHKPRGS